MQWSTACPDWEDRIVAGRSLIPFVPLYPAEAAAALEIFRDLRIKDVLGAPTMGHVCRQWVFDLVAAIFGAFDVETGRQLVRYFFLLVSKKNGKSTIAAGIMLTALIRNNRESGEFYILAPTKEVADNSFAPARDMVALDANLRDLLHVQPNERRITHKTTGAFLKVIAADSETVAGKKTIGLLVDELWQFGKRANAENMLLEAVGGLASRPEGFEIDLSTQSDHRPEGVFAKRLEEFRGIRDGKILAPRSLPILYEFPSHMLEAKAYELPENWYITNPNLGTGVDPEYLRDKLAEARRGGQDSLINFFAKHLNVQVGMALRADGWAGATVWERGTDSTLTLKTLFERSDVVTVGLDGGGLDDLLGIGVVGREKETNRWLGWGHALVSVEGLKRRKANSERYAELKRAGELTVFAYDVEDFEETDDLPPELIEGALLLRGDDLPPDIRFIIDLIQRIKNLGLLAQVGVDAAGIGAIVDALGEIDVTQDAQTLDAVRQGIALMAAIKTIERKLADRSFCHGGGLLLKWCAENLRIVPTPTGTRAARDETGYGKIDPLMALFNAAHLMALNPQVTGRGIFEFYRSGAVEATSQQQQSQRRPTPAGARLRAPVGISNVFGMFGQQYLVGDDRIVEVDEREVPPLLARGFEKIAEAVSG